MEWRTIARFPNHEVNENGEVRHRITKRMLKVNYNVYGIPRYYFYDKTHFPKPQRVVYARDLVAAAFVPNPNNYTLVRNIDGDVKNVSASNLEWIDD